MALLIPADPHLPIREVAPDNDNDFSWPQLCRLLSCELVEILPLADRRYRLVCDGESKLVGKPRNERATRLMGFVSPKQMVANLLRLHDLGVEVIWAKEALTDNTVEVDYIAGDALLCRREEVQ